MAEMDKSNECPELTNIKYKTMLLNGVPFVDNKRTDDLSNLDKFLANDKINNVNEPWCRLNKTIKTRKLQEYVKLYAEEHKLSTEEITLLMAFLRECIERKKLARVKDVVYDKETGTIKDIPSLQYIKSTKHFTLKNLDKRVSTLKSLAPKKKSQSTIKKKDTEDESSEEEEDI